MANKQLVTVKPKPNSRKFYTSATQFQKVTSERDGDKDVQVGDFKGERFPNSRQMFRPLWSYSKRRWMIKGYEDNNNTLDELVKKCKLKYPDSHPKRTHYIDQCDITDFSDPFFNHERLKILAKEGEFTLDLSRAFDQIIYMGLQEDREFAKPGDTNPLTTNLIKYVLTNKDSNKVHKKSSRDKEMEAVKLFSSMSFAKRVKVANSMGLIRSSKIDPDVLDELLWDAIKMNALVSGNKTKRDVFIELATIAPEKLALRDLVTRAKKKGILRKSKEGFLLFGVSIGRTYAKVESYLNDTDNSDMLIRLQDELKKNDTVNQNPIRDKEEDQ